MIKSKDFVGEASIAMESTTPLRHCIDVAFSNAGAVDATRAETRLSMVACRLVMPGAGVSIVDPLTASKYLGHGIIVIGLPSGGNSARSIRARGTWQI